MSIFQSESHEPPAVSIGHLSRFFEPSTHALTDVNLTIVPGERVAIVGPSGSGKSTLLSILGLLDQPTAGSYALFGREVSRLNDEDRTRARRDLLGFVFQAFHLIPHLTAQENVEYALQIAGEPSDAARASAALALENVGLSHRADSFPNSMSGGEQQRVAVARALARRPQMLLCDEPTGNLDSKSSDSILELLLARSDESRTILIVTHDMSIAESCDRRLYVADGRVSEGA
jgi:putative ABC transport system ATP-binding protein